MMEKNLLDKGVISLLEKIENYLKEFDCYEKPGRVFYSNFHTLKEGDFSIFGYNPGGSPLYENTLIKDELKDPKYLNPWFNAYIDESWHRINPFTKRPMTIKAGEDALQKSIQFIFNEIIEYDLRKVYATNLIFIRSQSSYDISNWKDLAEKCWHIHEEILKVVNPRVILSFGRDTSYFLAKNLDIKK